jgi:hypothetical protein
MSALQTRRAKLFIKRARTMVRHIEPAEVPRLSSNSSAPIITAGRRSASIRRSIDVAAGETNDNEW